MNLFLVVFTKTKTGAPRAPKLSYFDGLAPYCPGVNQGTPAAGVIGHMYYNITLFFKKPANTPGICDSLVGNFAIISTG